MDESFYRALVHQRAMSGWEIKWIRNITITLAAGVLTTLVGIGTAPVQTLIVTWAFAAAFFAIWEAIAFFHRRFYVAPFTVYREQLDAVSGLEGQILELRADNAKLARQLEARGKDQALADFLTERHAYGIRELLNKPSNATKDSIKEWRGREKEFTQGILAKMRDHKCTLQDLHHVEYIGVFPQLPLHAHQTIAKDLSMLTERLNRIADISTKYAND